MDKSAAITLASEEGGSWRTHHLKVRASALRQIMQEGWIAISYRPGDLQLADGLTKILQMLMRRWGLGPMEHVQELPEGEDDRGQLRQLQAPALNQQQQVNTAATSTANLGCCLGLVVTLQNIASVMGRIEVPEDHSPLAVDSSLELYAVVLNGFDVGDLRRGFVGRRPKLLSQS